MGYVVAHFRKVKDTKGLSNVANHNSRGFILDETGGFKEEPPAWMTNPTQITFNEGHQGQRGESIQRTRAGEIERANLTRKPQKNAAAAVEAVFSASPDSFKTPEEWKEFFSACRKWTEKKFGPDNVLQWNSHFDEKTPHMHVLLLPVIRDPERGNRYSSSEFLGGREGLRDIQTEIFKEVGEPRGLERGIEGSTARHTDQVGWKRELDERESKLDSREKELESRELMWDEHAEWVKQREKDVEALKKISVDDFAEIRYERDHFKGVVIGMTPKDCDDAKKIILESGGKTLGEAWDIQEKREQQQQRDQEQKRQRGGISR
jgi:hypothetical protein